MRLRTEGVRRPTSARAFAARLFESGCRMECAAVVEGLGQKMRLAVVKALQSRVDAPRARGAAAAEAAAGKRNEEEEHCKSSD